MYIADGICDRCGDPDGTSKFIIPTMVSGGERKLVTLCGMCAATALSTLVIDDPINSIVLLDMLTCRNKERELCVNQGR